MQIVTATTLTLILISILFESVTLSLIDIASRFSRSSRPRSFSSSPESKRQRDHSTLGQKKLEVFHKTSESTHCVASLDPRHNEAAKKEKHYLRYRNYPYNNYAKQCRSLTQLSGQSAAGKAHQKKTPFRIGAGSRTSNWREESADSLGFHCET